MSREEEADFIIESPPMSPVTKDLIAVLIIGFIVDFILMTSGIFFNFTFLFFHPVILVAVLTTAILRRFNDLKRIIVVRVLFILGLIITLDALALTLYAAYAWHPLMVLIPLGSYVLGLRIRKNRFLEWDRMQALIFPLFVTFLISMFGDSPESSDTCARALKEHRQPGIRLLVSAQEIGAAKHKFRYIMKLKNSRKIMVTYRHGFSISLIGFPLRYLDVIDPKARTATKWVSGGEVIGIYQSRSGRSIYALQNKDSGNSDLDLVIFNNKGKVKKRLPVPGARGNAYSASIFAHNKGIIFFVNSRVYTYDPKTGVVRRVPDVDGVFGLSMVKNGNMVYGVSSHSPLFNFLAFDKVKYDVAAKRILVRKRGPVLGYYEIREVRGTQTYLASHLWQGGGVLLDKNLETIRRLNIPRGTRTVALSPDNKLLFAPNFFTGRMKVLDMAANRLRPGQWYVGRGSRTMNDTEDGKILIGNSCGIVELDPGAFGGRR